MLSFGKLILKCAQLWRSLKMLRYQNSKCRILNSLGICENSICMYQKVTIHSNSDGTFSTQDESFAFLLHSPLSIFPETLQARPSITGSPLAKVTQIFLGSIFVFLFMLATSHRQTESFYLMRKIPLFLRYEDKPGSDCLSLLTYLKSLLLQKCCAVSGKRTCLHFKHCVGLKYKVNGFY